MVRTRIRLGKYNFPSKKDIPPGAKKFLNKMLKLDPKTRYSARDALEDSWINSQNEMMSVATKLQSSDQHSYMKSFKAFSNLTKI